MDLKKIQSLAKSGEIKFIDLRFVDLRGVWQHMTVPAHELIDRHLEKGFGFDGSSIRGFSTTFESDMLIKPDIATTFIDPFFEKTAVIICDVYNPATDKPFEKDPRFTAKKAEKYLQKSGIGDISYWGTEIEFFVFNSLYVNLTPYSSTISIKANEMQGQEETENDGYKMVHQFGYFPVPPYDKLQAFRSEAVSVLESIGVPIEVHHHEVAAEGQCEIDVHYDSLVSMADKVMKTKYVLKNLAKKYGMVACFVPKPIGGSAGSCMHTHQSIFKNSKNLFYDPKGYAEFSTTGLSYIAGLLSNISTVLAFSNPTINSYRRLVPHYEAPTSISFSKRNRSAAVRIPVYYTKAEKTKRLEFRAPDSACNPYLSFSAQLVYGLEGIRKKLDPTKLGFGPFEENIWNKANIKQTPGRFEEVLENLSRDTILEKSGVFSKSLLDSYLEVKREEVQAHFLYPPPADFWFYGDM